MIKIEDSTSWRQELEVEIDRLERLLGDLKRLRDGTYPSEAELAAAPLIVNPIELAIPVPAFAGLVIGHPEHGVKPVRTSAVEILADAWFRSSNRIYRLERYDGPVQ